MNNRRKIELVASALVVLLIIFIVISINLSTLPDRIALGGYSPIDWVNHLSLRANFVSDFPSGSGNYRYSLFMHIYPVMNQMLGVEVETLMRVIVVAEVAAMVAAMVSLTKTLFPNVEPVIPALVALFVISSSIGVVDLSRIAVRPYFAGLYYNVANASCIFAIAMAMRKHWWWSAIALSFSMATHPITGGLGLLLILVVVLFDFCSGYRKQALVPLLAALLLVGAWIASGVAQQAQMTGGLIPRDDWLAYTTALSFHWYPYAYGMLTEFHGQHLLPLITFAGLFYFYLPRVGLTPEFQRIWRWGGGGMLLLVAIGISVSVWVPAPFLVKLNLQRASQLLLWMGLPLIVAGLVNDVVSGAFWKRVVAGVLLVAPFVSDAAVPFFAFGLLVGGQIAPFHLRRPKTKRTYWLVLAAILIVIAWAVALGKYITDNLVYYVGPVRVWEMAVYLAVLSAIFSHKLGIRWANLLVLLGAAYLATSWTWGEWSVTMRSHDRAREYRLAQDWARLNTKPEALFLVDPLISYGWRDYSQRSSYGSLREWLHTSWLYDSNPDNYREGVRRFSELGLDARPYLELRPTNTKMAAFYSAVQERFYSLDDNWRLSISRRYGVDFFVMDRSRFRETSMAKVYENRSFVILDARSSH